MNRPPKPQAKPDKSVLAEWEKDISPELMEKLAGLEARRGFLAGVLKATALAGSMPLWGMLQGCDRESSSHTLLQRQPWQTFAAVQQHLFPADGNGPSAREIHSILYLKFVFDAPDTDPDDRDFLIKGVDWLNSLTEQQHGKPFTGLTYEQQDEALHEIAKSRAGERWLSHHILYIMEALLSDPIYGGNPNAIGWQWLEHRAGFPRPPANKRYTELL